MRVHQLIAACAAVLLLATGPVAAQQNPIDVARAAGIHGIEPDLSRSTGNELADQGQRVAWEQFGIYFGDHDFTAYVAALKPRGAALQQGAKVGDVMVGTDIMGGSKSLIGVLQAFARAAEREDRSLLLYVFDADSGWRREYRLTGAAPGGTVASIPPALRGAATSHRGLMAILRGQPDSAPAADVVHDAMLVLQAISEHPRACYGRNAERVPVRITVTNTTRDGFGRVRNQEARDYDEVLVVRREFADWARANISRYPTQAVSTVRSAVVDLLTQGGCTGPGFQQLEAGLARVMGVAWQVPEAPAAGAAGTIPADPNAFIAQCIPLQASRYSSLGHAVSERTIVANCFCMEHAARTVGNPELYAALMNVEFQMLEDDPAMLEAYRPAADACRNAPAGSPLRERLEAIWRAMRI